ncbi:hypothetical protein [Paenibacillus lutimineralis]|uniref:hypothetical protein n=1 Tax=Paenibacillus lutimineralis TaxID=2707005 RepID=UPI001D04241D|nr:hypothetical protein [Paenibacillus lutimineralis]
MKGTDLCRSRHPRSRNTGSDSAMHYPLIYKETPDIGARLAVASEGRVKLRIIKATMSYAVLNSLVETLGKYPVERIRKC